MFIFGRCHRSSAAVTPTKYEYGWNNLTCTFAWSKILLKEKLTSEALVTPTPELLLFQGLVDILKHSASWAQSYFGIHTTKGISTNHVHLICCRPCWPVCLSGRYGHHINSDDHIKNALVMSWSAGCSQNLHWKWIKVLDPTPWHNGVSMLYFARLTIAEDVFQPALTG